MTTNPYTLLIEMKLDGDYISQEAAVSFAKEYARLELERFTKQKLNIHSVMQGLPTENEISAMAILTVNLEDSDTAKIIHRAAFESGARWAISELSGSPTVGQRSVGTVAEGWVATPKPKVPLEKRLDNLSKKIRARKSSGEQP